MNCYRFPLLGPVEIKLTEGDWSTEAAFEAFGGKVTLSFFVENDYRTDAMNLVGVVHDNSDASEALDGEIDWDLSFLVQDDGDEEPVVLRLQQAHDDGERIEFHVEQDLRNAISVAFDAWMGSGQLEVFRTAMKRAKSAAKAVRP